MLYIKIIIATIQGLNGLQSAMVETFAKGVSLLFIIRSVNLGWKLSRSGISLHCSGEWLVALSRFSQIIAIGLFDISTLTLLLFLSKFVDEKKRKRQSYRKFAVKGRFRKLVMIRKRFSGISALSKRSFVSIARGENTVIVL